ncbi:MAG: GNAT family N-acetyltransferase [Flavobacterium sp.]
MKTDLFHIDYLKAIDANQLFEFLSDNNQRLKKYFPVTISCNSTLKKTVEYIEIKNKEIQEKTNFTFAIRNKITNQICGLIIIKKIDWVKKQCELAYCIGSEFESKGLTSFAVREITKFATQELELKTVQIIAHKSNIGSCKVAEKNDFIWQRTLPNEFTPINELPLNMELYELNNEK